MMDLSDDHAQPRPKGSTKIARIIVLKSGMVYSTAESVGNMQHICRKLRQTHQSVARRHVKMPCRIAHGECPSYG
jgi:hypothetical protein